MAKSTVVAVILALPLALPILAIIALAFTADASAWPKLLSGVLPAMTLETVLYCAGVSVGTLVVGTSLAFLITMFRFPGRNMLKWLAILPLAVPGYITAFAYVDTFSYAGSFQVMLRQTFGWTQPGDYHFPEIRSLGGAIFVMTAALYPYVYMSARAAFIKQSLSQIDAARTLGPAPAAQQAAHGEVDRRRSHSRPATGAAHIGDHRIGLHGRCFGVAQTAVGRAARHDA